MPVLSLEPGHEPYVESGIELCTQKLWYLLRDFHFRLEMMSWACLYKLQAAQTLKKVNVPVTIQLVNQILGAKEELLRF